jgi:flagellar protein FlgJ
VRRRPLALSAAACLLLLSAPAHAQGGSGTIRGTGKVSARATPGGKVLGKLRGGRQITITCQVNGPAANGSGGRSAIWDRITYGSRRAYVADAVVDTGGTAQLVAPYCGAPGPVRAVQPGTTSGACSITSPVPLDPPFTSHSAFLKAAVPGAQTSDRETKVPAAVTLAQAILESGWGRFSAGGNNYFGIKAQATKTPGVYDWGTLGRGCVLRKTQEEVRHRLQYEIAAFRAYKGLRDSIRDHGVRLRSNPVYAKAFDHTEDDTRFAKEIARYYATDSSYAKKLIDLIARYDLDRYDVTSGGATTGTGGDVTGDPSTGGVTPTG